ncbi:unnamed protein product [Urochloa decumbens]|uniref:Uncharacterized protein n=1 Tax=Urochloa decumbens TaxID=240449 RepID=A0ABC9BHB1_9POAL
MAGRFLFQKISSRISSRSLFWVGADIAAPVSRVSEGGIGTLGSSFHGSAAHPSTQIHSNGVIHHYEGRIGTLSNVLRGAPVRPSTATPGNSEVHGYAARYFNTLPWTCPAAKTSSPTNGMASVVAHRAKPAFVDFAGVKPTFSSNSPTKDTVTREAKRAHFDAEFEAKMSTFEYRSASDAELEAEKKAIRDDFKAWKTKLDKDVADFRSFVTRLVLVWIFVSIGFVVKTNRRSYGEGKSAEISASDNVQDPRAS